MSSNIEPVGMEEFDGNTIREYDLPDGEDPPLIWVDTSEDGYSAEWLVYFEADEFEEFLWDQDQLSPEGKRTVATITPDPAEGYKLRDPFEDVVSDQEYYSTDCTYFQVRTDEFDLGWEVWGVDEYRLILTVRSDDTEPLRELLYQSLVWTSSLSDAQESTIYTVASEADDVISRDYDQEG